MSETPAEDDRARVTRFYDLHPINLADVKARLVELHGSLDGITPEQMFEHDQDHYGGLDANDKLARASRMADGSAVLDVCCGIGGPARYYAWKYRAQVTGIDLTQSRVDAATELSEIAGLADRTRFVQGDAQDLPFDTGSFDVVVSQEAWLHLPDKRAAILEAFRVLKPGGSIAFTDWIAGNGYGEDAARHMWEGIAARDVISIKAYLALMKEAGFEDIRITDLTSERVPILKERRAMYDRLREEAKQRTGEDPYADYCTWYHRFVDLAVAGIIGGARFVGVKPRG